MNSKTRLSSIFCVCVAIVFAAAAGFAQANERGFARSESLENSVLNDEPKVAILVGIDSYDYTSNLSYAVADANALAEFFDSQGYIVKPVIAYEAHSSRIISVIESVSALFEDDGSDPEGTLVFAFSGHGFNDDKENYLATWDTDPQNLTQTAVPLSSVISAIENLNVRKKVLFIDACREDPGSATKNIETKKRTFLQQDIDSEGMAIMYSTKQGSLSWEDRNLERGVFTHYILEGLSGNAKDDAGLVSFDDLYKYVADRVKSHVFEYFNGAQKPQRSGEWSGDFILAAYGELGLSGAQGLLHTTESQQGVLEKTDEIAFDFPEAAADVDAVKEVWCIEEDKQKAREIKKRANRVFFGKYNETKDERHGWSLYMDSIKHCNVSTIYEISRTLERRGRCDLAIEYAQWAFEQNYKVAGQWLGQLKARKDQCSG